MSSRAETSSSAIRAQEALVAAAERDEAMATAGRMLRLRWSIGNRLVERAAKIDAGARDAPEKRCWPTRRDVDALHLTGCAAPTGQQFLTFGGLAVTAFTMQLPVKVDRDFLAAAGTTHISLSCTTSGRDGVTNLGGAVPRQGGRVMAKVVFMERSDQAGAFQKVMRTAETEIDSFGASGSGPMHEKLRAAYDLFLRGHPDLDPEQCFALAWNGLSLSDQDQIRSEESGEYQERLAEEARYRESSMRAERRGEGKQTMKHEQVAILLKAVRGVLADDELTKAEREDVLRETFDDYADRTGRDGLQDIASIPAAIDEPDLTKADTRHALAMAILEGKAEALRKVNPSLTREQAFSRVYKDPANAEIAKIERAANEARFVEQATSHSGDNIEKTRAHCHPRQRPRRPRRPRPPSFARRDPELSESQAFAKVYTDPANRALAAAERQSAASRFVRLIGIRCSWLPIGSSRRVLRFRRDCLAGGGTCPPAVALFSLSGFDDGRIYELRRSCSAICSRSGRHRGCQTRRA